MARRRRRRRLRIRPFLWLALVVVVLSGIFRSPITSLGKVLVIGARPSDQVWIERMLKRYQGRAALSISPQEIESLAMQHSEVRDAQFRRNLFGRGMLTIEYRKPVAWLQMPRHALIDELGRVYWRSGHPPGLPELVLPPQWLEPSFSAMNVWPSGKIAWLCKQVGGDAQFPNLRIFIDDHERICLMSNWKAKVIFGTANDLPLKLEVLRKILSENPSVFYQSKEVNFTAPDHVTRVPLVGK